MRPRSDDIALESRRSGVAAYADLLDAGERKRLIKFATVGAITTTIDIVVFTILSVILGLKPAVSNLFSYSTGVAASFVLHRAWTFHDAERSRWFRQLVRFLAVQVASLLLSTGVVTALSMVTPALAAKLASVFVVFFFNFSLNRSYVFGSKLR